MNIIHIHVENPYNKIMPAVQYFIKHTISYIPDGNVPCLSINKESSTSDIKIGLLKFVETHNEYLKLAKRRGLLQVPFWIFRLESKNLYLRHGILVPKLINDFRSMPKFPILFQGNKTKDSISLVV